MGSKTAKDKRANRTVELGEAMNTAIDPVFRKRGFASRDLVTNWAAIAPTPYDTTAMPDKLVWPRRAAGAEGAILYIRCAEGQKLAFAHEAQTVAAAVNRYFGYVLVGTVKLSAAPFTPGSGRKTDSRPAPPPEIEQSVDQTVAGVDDDGLRQALRRLGLGLLSNNR